MRRALGSTWVLLIITLISKMVGFVRELILLETVGIGAEIDAFVVLYGIVNLVSAALGMCVVTTLAPMAGNYRGRASVRGLMTEGLRVGSLTGLVALGVTLFYVATISSVPTRTSWTLATILSCVVPFSLLAEYQVALFLSRGWKTPIISGNIIISLPLAIALLIFDLSIVEYAIGLVVSFAVRAAIFAILLTRNEPQEVEAERSAGAVNLFGRRIWQTLSSGSAMLSVSAIFVTAQMTAERLGAGEATMIGYGLKVPQFVLTSLWFVLGTGFFAAIVAKPTEQPGRRIASLSGINVIFLCVLSAIILAIRTRPEVVQSLGAPTDSDTFAILAASGPFLPLIVLVPIIEMTQRMLVTYSRHGAVTMIAASVLAVGITMQVAAFMINLPWLITWSPVACAFAGCIAAVALLNTPPRRERGLSGF